MLTWHLTKSSVYGDMSLSCEPGQYWRWKVRQMWSLQGFLSIKQTNRESSGLWMVNTQTCRHKQTCTTSNALTLLDAISVFFVVHSQTMSQRVLKSAGKSNAKSVHHPWVSYFPFTVCRVEKKDLLQNVILALSHYVTRTLLCCQTVTTMPPGPRVRSFAPARFYVCVVFICHTQWVTFLSGYM